MTPSFLIHGLSDKKYEEVNAGSRIMWPVKKNHKGFWLTTLEKLMKEWLGGSHIVMKSTPKITSDRALMAIRYKCRSQKVLGFISDEGVGSTEPGNPYLSIYHDNYSYVSIWDVLRP